MMAKHDHGPSHWIQQGLTILMAIFLGALGIEGFLIPNGFIDGGVTGVSMLASDLVKVPLPVLLVLFNIPFICMAAQLVGRGFALRSTLAISGLALALQVVHIPHVVENDKLLGAVFGGFFLGAGVGLAMRAGSVLDGTEVLAVILSKQTAATVGEVILILNAVIFSVAALVLGVTPALYSALAYFTASKTIDYLMHGIEAYQGVMVISPQQDRIRQAILNDMGRGVTTFLARGGMSMEDREVLYCVVTRLEWNKFQSLVEGIDPQAFVVVTPVQDIHGGTVKRRSYGH